MKKFRGVGEEAHFQPSHLIARLKSIAQLQLLRDCEKRLYL